MDRLPLEQHLPEIVARVADAGALALVAEPGAGKTTRVPRALLDADPDGSAGVVVLEPRRLAARLAARRVAEELGEEPGGLVGWQVRFEDVSSARTRLRFVTEGILTRRLVADPLLRGVSTVVLDEFHERHLAGDLALALLRRLRRTRRPELRLVVMSATLEAEPVARFLDAPLLYVAGRGHKVEIEHVARESLEPSSSPAEVAARVATALARLLAEPSGGAERPGDVLVFLAGAAEIRRTLEACRPAAERHDVELVPLHGDLPPADQDRAVRPGPRRRLILSTNVAESSVTIPGVAVVIDTGLARTVRHSPWSGLPGRDTVRVSRASAAQRAGRAGRTGPGRCLRLYTRADHDRRPAHDLPEIRRADLSETLLALRSLPDDGPLEWLDAPLPAAEQAAEELLARLGALDAAGRLTGLGRRMARLPLHPRLGRLALAAAELGIGEAGCLLAALLGERDIRRDVRAGPGRAGARGDVLYAGSSDLLDRLEAFRRAERRGFRDGNELLDGGALRATARARDQLRRALAGAGRGTRRDTVARAAGTAPPTPHDEDSALGRAVLAGFPDRVARRRRRGSDELLLSGGGAARLAETSVVREAELLVAVEAELPRPGAGDRPALPLVRLASALEPEWLLEQLPERLAERTELRFDARAGRVEASAILSYDRLVLHENRVPASGPEAERALAEAALAAGPGAFCDAEELAAWRARVAFAAAYLPGLPPADDEAVRAALVELCRGRRSFAELRAAEGGGLVGALRARLESRQRAAVERLAPERVVVGGRRIRVGWKPGREPWIESRLQDFFGLVEGPRIADGRVPLVLHLLAPS
ncbi:MAG: ATP-dependent helicase HrpB, partial [Deltaproteobacteria bacterium]|nr:ATP-dependent helicase HrpB [Deltaproteobacteria bacterium]